MIYLIKSYGYRGKSVLKIGFTDDIQKRIYQYFSSNPMMEVLSTREGDEIFEKLLHRYLYYLGFQYKRFGRLDEWFIDSPEVKRIFHISRETLEKKIWKHRDKILDISSSTDFRLFEYLYQNNKEGFIGNEFNYVDGKLTRTKAKNIDISFWSLIIKRKSISSEDINDIVSVFLKEFYSTGIFTEKMRMYCEFRDKYVGDQEILAALNVKIDDQKFKMYYEYYGTSGCKSRGYRDLDLYRGFKNITLEDQLQEKILLRFKVGDRYSKSEIKEVLTKFREELGISGVAKATDLGRYFKLTKTSITNSDKTVVNGFKLGIL